MTVTAFFGSVQNWRRTGEKASLLLSNCTKTINNFELINFSHNGVILLKHKTVFNGILENIGLLCWGCT